MPNQEIMDACQTRNWGRLFFYLQNEATDDTIHYTILVDAFISLHHPSSEMRDRYQLSKWNAKLTHYTVVLLEFNDKKKLANLTDFLSAYKKAKYDLQDENVADCIKAYTQLHRTGKFSTWLINTYALNADEQAEMRKELDIDTTHDLFLVKNQIWLDVKKRNAEESCRSDDEDESKKTKKSSLINHSQFKVNSKETNSSGTGSSSILINSRKQNA